LVLTLRKWNVYGHAGQTRPLLGATADVRASKWMASNFLRRYRSAFRENGDEIFMSQKYG
jgi:hypothetical protein